MFLYNPKRLKKPITLSAKDLSLLHIICDLGFVNDLQIHLLYSVVQRYPSVLSHTILSEWCSFSGLLQKRPKPKSSSSSNVTHAVYIPTNSCRAYLQEQHIPISMVNDVAVNSHNEQAIEVIVQALYNATFKYATYGITDNLFNFSNGYRSLSKPEEIIRCINKPESINKKSKAPFNNQIIVNQKNVTSNYQSNFLNQIVQSERPTRRTLTATESSLLGLWLKRHLIYLRDITNTYSTDLLLPVTTKQLYDSLLDGSITNKQLQFLLNSINYSNTDTNNYSNSLLDSNTLSSNSSSYIREKGLSTSSNAVEARLADSSDYSSDLSELFEDADSNPSDEQLDLFDVSVSGSSGSKDSDSRSKESSRSRDARSNTEATGKYENSSEKPVKDEISDSQAQLDSLLGGMSDTQKGGNQASSDILGHNENINTNRNKTVRVPERFRNDADITPDNLKNPGFFRKSSGAIPERFRNDADISPDNLKNPGFFRKSSGTIPERFRNDADISPDNLKNLDFFRKSSGTIPERFRNDADITPDNLKNPGFFRKSSGTIPERFRNDADISPDNLKNLDFFRKSSGTIPERFRNDVDITPDNLKNPGFFRKSSGTIPERFRNDVDITPDNLKNPGFFRKSSGTIPEKNQIDVKGWTPLFFDFPNSDFHQIIQTAPQSEFFFERIGTLELYLKFAVEAAKSESNQKSEKSAFRYSTLSSSNLLRNLNLISNPNFDLDRFDTSSFKNQYKYYQYTFVADEMISFARNERRQEVFVELDNRTESNKTQIQKILNYIDYALHNPQRDVLLSMAITDGSLASKKYPTYNNIGRKLATLADKFMKSFIPDENGEKKYLSELYRQASNLHIVFTGVSESQIDISQFILGSNFSLDYLHSIKSYVNRLNKDSDWTAEFTPSSEFNAIISNPHMTATSLNDLHLSIVNSRGKGIWRYVEGKQSIPLLGEIHLKNRLSRDTLTQPVIAGDEHSLDTVLDTYKYIYLSRHDKSQCPPLVVYPTRERPVTAITLNEYKNLYNWTNNWRANIPVLYQPLDHSYLQLHKELRWLTMQYDLDIYNFFKHGYINKTALSKGLDYGSDYIEPLKYAFNMHPRTYNELHDLALSMDKKDFVDQLKLNEIPLNIFKIVMERWPKGQYSLPLIKDLDYLDQNQAVTQREYLNLDPNDCIYAPNSIYPDSRLRLRIKKSY